MCPVISPSKIAGDGTSRITSKRLHSASILIVNVWDDPSLRPPRPARAPPLVLPPVFWPSARGGRAAGAAFARDRVAARKVDLAALCASTPGRLREQLQSERAAEAPRRPHTCALWQISPLGVNPLISTDADALPRQSFPSATNLSRAPVPRRADADEADFTRRTQPARPRSVRAPCAAPAFLFRANLRRCRLQTGRTDGTGAPISRCGSQRRPVASNVIAAAAAGRDWPNAPLNAAAPLHPRDLGLRTPPVFFFSRLSPDRNS